jgi:PAS domain S-box-containing protein
VQRPNRVFPQTYNAAQMNDPSGRRSSAPLVAGIFVVLVGLLGLLGWILDVQALRQPVHDASSMKANTAIALVLCGLALTLLSTRRFIRAAVMLSALGGVVAALTVSQDLLRFNLGIDEVLFSDSSALAAHAAGRMAPLTAACILAIAIALIASLRSGGARLSQGLALFALLVSTVVSVGYLYNARRLVGIGSYATMAPQTAVLLVLLSIGVLFLQLDRGVMKALSSRDLGGRMARRTLPATIAIPIVLGWLRLEGERAGLYDTKLGPPLIVFGTMILLSIVVWLNARQLDEIDGRRKAADEALRLANEGLETRIADKTAEALRNQQQATENAEMFFRLFEFAPDAIVAVDQHGTIERINARTEELFGYSRSELLGRPVEILIPERLAARHVEHRDRYLQQPRSRPMGVNLELLGRRKDGQEFPVDVMLSPADSPRGQLTLGVIRDTTERRRAEEALRVAEDRLHAGQRMEAMGRFAGGIAHDFNNMMTIVSGYSELLLGQHQVEDAVRRGLQEIRKAGDRCATLTRHLLAFGRRQILTPSVLDLNSIVSELGNVLPMLVGEDVSVTVNTDPGLRSVRADRAQIEQVIVNLVINARDAMPSGGTLTIETRNTDVDERTTSLHRMVPPGPYVLLSVADTGIGMDAETQARAFDPFFTTKPVGQGTGLGLSMVYGVIKQSDGHIYVDSAPGQGATFHVYLPPIDGVAQAFPAPGPSGMLSGHETVLLVEDEESLRQLLRQLLGSAGYSVLEAANGQQALQVSQNHNAPIHLVVTDVVMPGMSGLELVEQLGQIRRETKALLISGYAQNLIVERAIGEGPGFLQKPFTPDALLSRIRDVLDGTPRHYGQAD